MSKYGWSNNNLIVNKITIDMNTIKPGSLEGVSSGSDGFILKNLKNSATSNLSGTQRDIKIDVGGTAYYFTVYPTKA